MKKGRLRCQWCGEDPLYVQYHDEEWGRPIHDDGRLFEMLVLEGQQAGLSWLTILKKRENFRKALDRFDAAKIAHYNEQKLAQLQQNTGIIRNRLKIKSFVQNAQGFLKVQEEFGSFDRYLWDFVEGQPLQNTWQSLVEIPAQTPISEKLSRDLKKRGFNFVGPTICYAYMQSTGMVNDHIVDCFRYQELKSED